MQPLVSRTPLASPCNRSSQEHHWQAHATTRLKSRAKTKSDMRQINGPITTKAWNIIGRNAITNGTVIWYVQIISIPIAVTLKKSNSKTKVIKLSNLKLSLKKASCWKLIGKLSFYQPPHSNVFEEMCFNPNCKIEFTSVLQSKLGRITI